MSGPFKGHRRIRHRAGVYVAGEVHTNIIEGFFGLLKNGIRGVYHAVSREYLRSYLDKYSFRYNARNETRRCSGSFSTASGRQT